MANVLSIRKPTAPLSPHRQALKDNLLALRELRSQVNALSLKDHAAAADQALCEATQQQIQSVQDAIDRARADALYANRPAPDVHAQERQIEHLQQLLKSQSDTARAATLIRAKFAAEMNALNYSLSERAKAQPKLLFDALREDCLARLASEFLAAEQAFLSVHKKVFAAALATDTIAKENHYGEFCGSGNIADLHISRPSHPAFDPHPLLPEQAQAKRREYVQEVAEAAAALVQELLSIADDDAPRAA